MRARRSASATTEMRSPTRSVSFALTLCATSPRDRVVGGRNLGQKLRAGRVVERAGVGNLPARFGVDRRAVKHDFARFASLQLVDRPILPDDRLNANVFRSRTKVKILLRLKCLRNLRISRIRRLFVRTFPRRPRPFSLFFHRLVEAYVRRTQALGLGTRPE